MQQHRNIIKAMEGNMYFDRLNVLMTTDTLSDLWSYSLYLTKALEPYHVQVHLAAMGAMPTADQLLQAAQHPNLNLHTSTWKLEWMTDAWEDVEAAGYWLKFLQSEIRPDLIHLNHYSFGSLGWQLPLLMCGHHCALSSWEATQAPLPLPEEFALYRQRAKAGLQKADMVVATNKSSLHELQKFFGPLHHTSIIPNAVYQAPEPATNKQDFVLAAGKPGDEAQNLAFCEKIAALDLSWPLLLAGDAAHQQSLPFPAGHLDYLGNLPASARYAQLAAASIYLHPALYDPIGIGVMEAASRGCALVLSNIAPLREMWQDAAVFISPKDPKTAHKQLQELIEDQDRQKSLGKKAKARAAQFTLKQEGRLYYNLYQQLLQQKAASSQPLPRLNGKTHSTQTK